MDSNEKLSEKIINEYERCNKIKSMMDPDSAALEIFAPYGLDANYTESSLKKAYRAACKICHPDVLSYLSISDDVKKVGEDLFKIINEKNELLKKKLKGENDTQAQSDEVYQMAVSTLSNSKLENNGISSINGIDLDDMELFDIQNLFELIAIYKKKVNDIIDKYLKQIQKTSSPTTIMVLLNKAREESSLAVREYAKEVYEKYLKGKYKLMLDFIDNKEEFASRKEANIIDRITPQSDYAFSLKNTNELLGKVKNEFITNDKRQEQNFIKDIEQRLDNQLNNLESDPNLEEIRPYINEEKTKIINECLKIRKGKSYQENKNKCDNDIQRIVYGFTTTINKKLAEMKEIKIKIDKLRTSIDKLRVANSGNKKIEEILNLTLNSVNEVRNLSDVQPLINAMYNKIVEVKKEEEKQDIANKLNIKVCKANEGKTAEEMMQNFEICTKALSILPNLSDDKVKDLLNITFENAEKDNLILDELLTKKEQKEMSQKANSIEYDEGPDLLYSGFENERKTNIDNIFSPANRTNESVHTSQERKEKSNFERIYNELFNNMNIQEDSGQYSPSGHGR